MSQTLDFQSIIMALQKFWAEQGCLVWQPYYQQVGAGTLNPATVLRVLGPEPWNVAYVEPSVRPDDGRYGENPNRLQMHYQFQVILKPDPGNPQELYLRSLEAIGVDPRKHDIRFVEDNWESPALGAWGLGWEVWLDGQEITQFTYFQQAGGMQLDPVSVEITYGLERIAIVLQGVRSFRDLRWDSRRTYGEVNLQGEYEHSKYYFEGADVERLRQMYALFQAEAESALAQGLVLPAHDYILKCSHTFNVLDARGAVGVTERQQLFGRMRDLSRRVAEAYYAQRQQQEFPWLNEETRHAEPRSGEASQAAPATGPATRAAEAPADFLFEIGTEEIPAADLQGYLEQLRERLPAWLDDLRLAHGEVRVYSTPRRLAVHVEKLAARQPDREVIHKGPPAARAFDAQGNPTPAAEGFARGKGLPVSALQVREMDGGSYAAAVVQESGKTAVEVLSAALPGWIASLKVGKSMRWNANNTAFSRPIRWLLALFDGQVVPFEYAGLRSGNLTRGLRFHTPENIPVASVADYFAALKAQNILLNPDERRAEIAAQAARLMRQAGGAAQVDEDLLDEVNNLVEAPTALIGHFEDEHLRLPPEVLISVMKKHQRYFPVQTAEGKLLPHFIVVRNGDDQFLEVVADGNAQVIRARFADAAFFIGNDRKRRLEEYVPALSALTFQAKLGSMLEKTARIEQLVEKLLPAFGLAKDETTAARRAAHLCKADLATSMVVEMTSLQGTMGRYYALDSGEERAAAQAIYDHYQARPAGKPGLLIGLADKLDSLMGLFAAGLAPSGTKDPYAQRRAALGLVQSLIHWDLDFDLRAGLALAAEGLPLPAPAETQAACLEFISGRLRSLLIEQEGLRYDVVDAALAAQPGNPAGALRAARQLSAWVARPDWSTILPAYARCVRITRPLGEQRYPVTPAALSDPAERELLAEIERMEAAPRRPASADDLLNAFLPAIPAINRFFDAVLVMAEQPEVRANRLGLLQRIAALAQGVADLSLLEGF